MGAREVYEPEVTAGGRHLEALTSTVVVPYLRGLPDIALYTNLETLGKFTPSSFGSP